MGLPEQYCPVCGGPFVLPELFDDNNHILSHCWASILPEQKIQWLEEFRLIGRTRCVQGFCEENALDIPKDNSDIEGFFVSDYASCSDGYIFTLNGIEYRTFHSDNNGDIMLPVHNACIEIIRRVLWYQNMAKPTALPRASLETFYNLLCKQYERNREEDPAHYDDDYGLYGLEWCHGYYGARVRHCYNGWYGVHGVEWYLADPIIIPDLTDSILPLLTQYESPPQRQAAENCTGLQISEETSIPPEKSSLEKLPSELLLQIGSYLPLPSIFNLRLASKTITSRLSLDQQFWLQGLLSGILVPHLWDHESKAILSSIGQDISDKETRQSIDNTRWDWEKLAKSLIRKNSIMAAERMWEGVSIAIGFRNRCRIWRIVEEALEYHFNPIKWRSSVREGEIAAMRRWPPAMDIERNYVEVV